MVQTDNVREILLSPITNNSAKLSLVQQLRCTATATLLVAYLFSLPATANTCSAKRWNVRQVCGIVVNNAGHPLQGIKLQLLSASGVSLSGPLYSRDDGSFTFPDAPKGDLFLEVTDQNHGGGRWPLRVARKLKAAECKKPLVVHQAGTPGWGCGNWIDKKLHATK
jgi:hypothetical protein